MSGRNGCSECVWVKLPLKEITLDKTDGMDETNGRVDGWTASPSTQSTSFAIFGFNF